MNVADQRKASSCGRKGWERRVDLRLNRVLMRLVALWPPSGAGGWRGRLYWLYGGGVLLLESGFVLAQLLAVLEDWGDLDEVTINLCLAVAYVMAVFKIYYFYRTRATVDRLVTKLDSNMQRYCWGRGGDGGGEVAGRWSLSRRRGVLVTVTYMLVGFVALVSCAALPLLRPSPVCGESQRCRLQRDLPAKVLVPDLLLDNADGGHGLVFALCYALVVTAIFYGYACTCLLDVFYTRIVIYVSGQLAILNVLVRDHRRLRDVLSFHEELDGCVQELSGVLSPIVLGHFLCNVVTVSLSTFLATAGITDTAWLLKYVSFLAAMVAQVFLFCWYGHDVIAESEQLLFSAYTCDWTSTPAPLRSSLRIFMERCKRPLRLTGGKFYVLSRETFLKLLNASLSYFAVLRQISEKRE